MTDDEIKRYEESLRQAAAKCDEWFIKNHAHFQNRAKIILELHKAGKFDLGNACLGKFDVKKGKMIIPNFTSEADALLAYYTAIITLHDTAEGYVRITQDIWPEEVLLLAKNDFAPHFGDKSAFIEASIRHIEADLLTISAEIKSADLAAGENVGKTDKKQKTLLTGLSEKEKSKELNASIPVFASHLGMLAKANTIEDVISALKNDIVRYWVNYNYLATADFLLSVTRMILIHLRDKSDKAYSRIPPISDGWLGIKDWITDNKKTENAGDAGAAKSDNNAVTREQKNTGADIGRKGRKNKKRSKYTIELLKRVRAAFDRRHDNGMDVKGAWNEAAEDFGIKSGKATEMACRRYLKKQNK